MRLMGMERAACLLLVFLVLGIINLLFLLKEARKRNEAAIWDLCPGASRDLVVMEL